MATITGSVSGAGGTIIYEHRDHLSPRIFTDANGNCVGDQGTYPFGELWYRNNDPNCSNTATSSWIFTSYERDQESVLDYALARSYSNSLGRFMSPDPLGGSVDDPQSLNRYAYVVNDPVNGTDPSGQDDCFDACDPGSDQIDNSSMAEGEEGSTPLGTQNPPVPAAEGCYLCGLLDRLRGLFGGGGGWGGDDAPPLLAQAGGGGIGGGNGGTGQNTSGVGRVYPPGFAGKLQPGDVYGPYTADLNRKDMAFAKTNYNPVKHFFGAKSEIPQCVALTKYFTNMPLDMRGNAQRAWRQGPAGQTPIRVVDMLATLKPGTAIGAGWFNGRWPSDGHPNSGIYIGPGQAPGSIRILDQWTGHWPQTRELRPRALYAADSSDMYYVIYLAPVP
jgi:RHS repeat-associated protein